MKNLSRFDLGMIIAFVVVALLGGGAWYYLSGQLAAAQSDAAAAAGEFDQYTKKEVYLPTGSNVKTLQANIDVMTAQLDPLVKNVLQSPENKLPDIQPTDTVQWKHQLDDEVKSLNAEAKISGITVPANFYYGFSRYLNTNPELRLHRRPEPAAPRGQGNRRHPHQGAGPRHRPRPGARTRKTRLPLQARPPPSTGRPIPTSCPAAPRKLPAASTPPIPSKSNSTPRPRVSAR